MKKITFIFAIFFATTLFFSCGNGDKEDDKQKTETNKNEENTYTDSYVSIELDSDWDISQGNAINKKTNYSVFSFGVYSSGNIYEDFLVDHEQVGEITETTVDGMPAITRLQKYKAKEKKLGRVWLINNGTDIISFNIDAPENSFDDKVAQEIIKNVKVLNKGKDVKLHVAKAEKTYYKPDVFPEEILNQYTDSYSKEVLLTVEKLQNAINLMDKLNNLDTSIVNKFSDEENTAYNDSLFNSYSFNNMEDLINNTYQPAFRATIVFSLFEGKDTDMVEDALIKDMISQNPVSYEDIKFTYDNWDLVVQLYRHFEKKE